ncbi:RNA-directed DNA polymerase, eukaryota [Tanacetum coccineum]|uniref:RNA-directed DNA polymerase, eukaryota n=1 Tax=Tanacetum coccineum TaxID=301880 RepID=A0ABQ5FE53_9ASTR
MAPPVLLKKGTGNQKPGHRPTYPRLYALESCKSIDVAAKLAHSSMVYSFRCVPRGGVEQSQLADLMTKVEGVSLVTMNDRWVWSLEGSGDFSVASVRRLIDDKRLPEVSSKTRWIKAVPIKVNVHAWKVRLDCLPTRINISRRGMNIDSILCPICANAVESSRHLFFDCHVARETFRKIIRWWVVSYMEVSSYTEWLAWILNLRLSVKHKRLLEGVCYASSSAFLQRVIASLHVYAEEILERAHMQKCNLCRTLVDTESKLGADGDSGSGPTLYRSLAIALQCLTFTCPDISSALQQVFLYMHDPRELHLAVLKRFLHYLRVTRGSTSGYCVFLSDNLLSWSSKRQVTLSRSSAEAEYRGVANVVVETGWVCNLWRELHAPLFTATLIYCDNVSVVYMSTNPVQHQCTKHIEIDIHFVLDFVTSRRSITSNSVDVINSVDNNEGLISSGNGINIDVARNIAKTKAPSKKKVKQEESSDSDFENVYDDTSMFMASSSEKASGGGGAHNASFF